MTTIAVRGLYMAADSLTTDELTRVGLFNKIYRSPDGALGAVAGYASDASRFGRWLEGGMVGEAPSMHEDSEAIVLMPSGEVRWYDSKGMTGEIRADFWALGTGRDLALGALAMGATAEQAVAVAVRLDTRSGGPVLWHKAGKPGMDSGATTA